MPLTFRPFIALFLSALGCLAAPLSAFAQAEPMIERVRFGAEPSRTRIVLESDQALDYAFFTLASEGDRLVVDLPRVDWRAPSAGIGAGQLAAGGEGFVDRVRFAHKSEAASRVVFDLNAPVTVRRHFRLEPDGEAPQHRLVLDLEPTSRDEFARAAGFPQSPQASATKSAPATSREAASPPRSDRIVIVLDAGHGGKDPGATGDNGLVEKKVVLAATHALRDKLEAMGRYDVVLTRDDDTYLTLQDRVKVAREAEASLFISIHADSAPKSVTARGASVYTLAERATERARREILREQNWLIDVDLDGRTPEVNDILIDLAQRETKNQSATFAEFLIPRLKDVSPVVRNTHRSAGYYVLLAPDVPAVLVELGFLTNPLDEQALATERHRERLATSIAAAIDDYFKTRERLLAAR